MFIEPESFICLGSLFHSLVMKSIGDSFFIVVDVNLLCLMCSALSLHGSMNCSMAFGSFLWMNFHPYMHAWDLKMSSVFKMCIAL